MFPIKAWTDHELLEHRDKVTKKRPSLPNKAGKVYQSLLAGKVQPRAVTYGPVINKGKLKGHRISIRSVVQPEPDLKKLADALVSLAREQIEREKREQRERGKAA